MASRKPAQFAPSRQGRRSRAAPARKAPLSVGGFLAIAAGAGLVLGTGSLLVTPEGREGVWRQLKPAAVRMGLARARAPQEGDYWAGCNSARAAGTAPIYYGEPGYRSEMDGDDDGIACEPHR